MRVVTIRALRSHILSDFHFADFHIGETTLAREMWQHLPEGSLVIVDRSFLVKKDLIALERSGNRHWLTRTKKNTRWSIAEKLGEGDYLSGSRQALPRQGARLGRDEDAPARPARNNSQSKSCRRCPRAMGSRARL